MNETQKNYNTIDYVITISKKDMQILDALLKLNQSSNIIFRCENEKEHFLFTQLSLGEDFNYFEDEIKKEYSKIKSLLDEKNKDLILDKSHKLLMDCGINCNHNDYNKEKRCPLIKDKAHYDLIQILSKA
ncbi:hypothetical protein ACTXUC_000546 [Campylobacter upsaliensis]